MALTDSDVQKQIKHMMAFIEQEANEKAEEIDTKAEEEFNIEKSRIFQENKIKIMEYFEKKEKQVELQRRIQNSQILNEARLKVLQARQSYVNRVLDEALEHLVKTTKDEEMYKKVLQKLIEQGLFQLVEKEVKIRCKKDDEKIVKAVIPEAVKQYENSTNRKVNVKLDAETYLSSDCHGGVELFGYNGKIKCCNTLESRLEMISKQLLPDIRVALFGRNSNRKFDE